MECEYFGRCGACVNYKNGYEAQLQDKLHATKERFSKFYNQDIKIFRSPEKHYRQRAEFRIWHSDNEISYAMNGINKTDVVKIDECPQVAKPIYILMPKLLKELSEIKHKLFGVDFLSSSDGEIVVSLLYHKKLDDEWKQKAQSISERLDIHIIGRSRKQKVVIGQDFVNELLHVDQKNFIYKHIENSFTQPNARVNESMIKWAMQSFSKTDGDLLELYCGAGNFTIPFAGLFGNILATEISKSSIKAAKDNMELNGVKNIEFLRMSVEEFRDAIDGVREFRRFREVDISKYDLKNLFVDPPRSGMGEVTCKFASRFENIVYISCNPLTLKEDLDILTHTHKVVDMAIFDQFAYTNHLEMGVKLTKV